MERESTRCCFCLGGICRGGLSGGGHPGNVIAGVFFCVEGCGGDRRSCCRQSKTTGDRVDRPYRGWEGETTPPPAGGTPPGEGNRVRAFPTTKRKAPARKSLQELVTRTGLEPVLPA